METKNEHNWNKEYMPFKLWKLLNYEVRHKGDIKKYTNEIIHNVCRLIEKGENTLAEISNITNVGFYTIADIKRHKTWKNISCNYDF